MKTKFYILYVFIASTSLMYSQVRLGGGGDPVGFLGTSAAFIDGSSNNMLTLAISTREEESFFHIQI